MRAPSTLVDLGSIMMGMYYKRDIDQVKAFIEECTVSQGRGFYLDQAHTAYMRWCKKEKQDRWLGRTRFGIFLEDLLHFDRAKRRDRAHFTPGGIKLEWLKGVEELDHETVKERKTRIQAEIEERKKYREERKVERENSPEEKERAKRREGKSIYLQRLLGLRSRRADFS